MNHATDLKLLVALLGLVAVVAQACTLPVDVIVPEDDAPSSASGVSHSATGSGGFGASSSNVGGDFGSVSSTGAVSSSGAGGFGGSSSAGGN